MPVPLAEPGAVVPVLELEEGLAQLLDGPERPHPEQLLLGGPSRPPVRCPTKLQGGREIPNLRQRANAYLGYLAERYLFGRREAEAPPAAAGERAWFVGYGIASFERRVYERALSRAAALAPGRDFVVEARERSVRPTEAGQARLRDLARPPGGVWGGRLRREELARQALVARHLFERDRHYLVSDGRVQIIDEFTGRLMADRSWEQGLHQLIEVKEDGPVTRRHDALARISYQHFLRRSLRLAGMIGTAREVAGELWRVYRLAVVTVPTDRPLDRRAWLDRVHRKAAGQWQAAVECVGAIHTPKGPLNQPLEASITVVDRDADAASETFEVRLGLPNLEHRVTAGLKRKVNFPGAPQR